jgi:alkaline phosphatase
MPLNFEVMSTKWLVLGLVVSGLVISAWQLGQQRRVTEPKRPKNIILMIGDGMGLTQISVGMYAQQNNTSLENFPVTGLVTTHSAKHLVTDSGAGATAIACGCKTYNGAIGVDKHRKPCRTLLEEADSLDMGLGIVVSCTVTHATPGSFVAHVLQRIDHETIAEWYLKNKVDYLVGGGRKYFNKRTLDNRQLIEELQQAGYLVQSYDQTAWAAATPDPKRPYIWFAAEEEPPAATEGRTYLPLAAAAAPPFFSARSPEKGFFLMIEGSQIDWACHANDAPRLIAEMKDFDAAVKAMYEWAAQDGETLVIVTADHETGGVSIQQGSTMDSLDLMFNTKGHTASMVPVFAFGPGAEAFAGLYDNTEIYHRIRKAMGWAN